MSVDIDPNRSTFEESRWITSEDVNVEHLLDIFTTIDGSSDSVWDACANFMQHLSWHKKRLVVLGPRIEELPDGHHSKPECLFELSRLFYSVGDYARCKQLVTHALKLERERGRDHGVAQALRHLSDVNRLMGFTKEGIQQAKEAWKVLEWCGDTVAQAQCLMDLARLLYSDKQLNAAEEAAYGVIDLITEEGNPCLFCQSHPLLGYIYRSKGERESPFTISR